MSSCPPYLILTSLLVFLFRGSKARVDSLGSFSELVFRRPVYLVSHPFVKQLSQLLHWGCLNVGKNHHFESNFAWHFIVPIFLHFFWRQLFLASTHTLDIPREDATKDISYISTPNGTTPSKSRGSKAVVTSERIKNASWLARHWHRAWHSGRTKYAYGTYEWYNAMNDIACKECALI